MLDLFIRTNLRKWSQVKEIGKVMGVPEWLNYLVWSSRHSNSSLNRRYNQNENNNFVGESRL